MTLLALTSGGYVNLFQRFHYDSHQERQCRGKHCYTKTAARTTAARWTAWSGEVYDYYRCTYCRRWHVGHRIERTTS